MYPWLEPKIEKANKTLMLAAQMSKDYYQKPLIITYSGGKDSDVMLQLAIDCLDHNDFEVINSHTTVDAPETVYYIRDKFKELNFMGIKATINYPRDENGNFISMWSLIVKNQMPPTRLARYCCKELKESKIPNRFVAVGVRSQNLLAGGVEILLPLEAKRKKMHDSILLNTLQKYMSKTKNGENHITQSQMMRVY
jgi:3''-phosphoadenosine 5''-phosphosulfate sulfotransferase (PAPS reductase)/FAD synthetase and related enzymes